MFLTEKYLDCFVEYRPVMDSEGVPTDDIECVNDNSSGWLGEIEKEVDIARARKAGCRGAVQICNWLNGRR